MGWALAPDEYGVVAYIPYILQSKQNFQFCCLCKVRYPALK